MTDLTKQKGLVRTDLYCHNCEDNKLPPNFTAVIDFDLNGNHKIECPRCGHLHFRKVKDGVVTSDRYDRDSATHVVERKTMWKSTTQPIMTSTASAFLRDRWLNRGG